LTAPAAFQRCGKGFAAQRYEHGVVFERLTRVDARWLGLDLYFHEPIMPPTRFNRR
jgi:hypothetical protein